MVKNIALVLGGGGAAGNPWRIGIIAGLAEAGLDMTEATEMISSLRQVRFLAKSTAIGSEITHYRQLAHRQMPSRQVAE